MPESAPPGAVGLATRGIFPHTRYRTHGIDKCDRMNSPSETEGDDAQLSLDLGWSEPTGFGRLAPGEQRFVREFLACGNGAEAARRAGYSEAAAKQQAHAMLGRPDVRRCIDEAAHKAGVDSARVIARNERAAVMWHAIAFDDSRTIKERKAAADAARNHDALLMAATGKGNLNLNTFNFATQVGMVLTPDVLAHLAEGRKKAIDVGATAGNPTGGAN